MSSTREERSFRIQKTAAMLAMVLLLGGFWLYGSILVKGSQPSYGDYDPEMDYFMNSLAPFKGASYFYTDHPGTPIEMIGTLLLGTIYVFFGGHANFVNYQLAHPEVFLNLARGLIALLSILCAVYFFRTVLGALRKPNVYLALLLALLYYGLHPFAFKTLTLWSHTSFNFPLGAGYLLLLFRSAQDARGPVSDRLAAGLGLAAGALMAVMINFAPWLVTALVFIVLSNASNGVAWRKSLRTGSLLVLACAAGFFVSILPSIQRMPYFFGFLNRLFTHQALYGTGSQGLPSLPLLWSNLHKMLVSAPVLFLVMLAVLCLSLFILRQHDSRVPELRGLWALHVSLLMQCGMIILVVLKHPGGRYLLPLAATLPVWLLVMVKLSDFDVRFSRRLGSAIILFSTIGIGGFALLSIQNRQAEVLEARAVAAELDRIIIEQENHFHKKPGQMLILRTNETYSYCSALLHGDFFTGGVFSSEVNAWCPSQAYYFVRFDWVLYRGEHVPFQDLPWDILLARTWALDDSPAWKDETIHAYPQNIYLVIHEK